MMLAAISACSFLASVSSCAFIDTGSGTQIKNITTTYDESTGNTIIFITFTDESMDPVTFIIPRGKEGVSIKNVTSKMSSDGKSIELTISYNDGKTADTVLSIPVIQGRGIKEVIIDKDEKGNPTIKFVYTDGTESSLITIPSGKDGNGIESFEVSDPDSNGSMTVVVTFSDGSSKTFTIKNGKDGISVLNITYNEDKSDATHYVLTVTYSDGYTEDIYLERPHTNYWYTGTTSPDKDSKAKENATEGDFYLNITNGYVYQKGSDGSWTFLFGMKSDDSSGEEKYYTVLFNPLEGKINGSSNILMANVLEGRTISLANIPTPTLENHTFSGWYTDLNNVNSGKFTDMTPVYSNLTLYAKYE